MRKLLRTLFWPLVMAALVLAFFAPALWTGRVLAPGDGIAQFLPIRVLIAQCLRHGEWPFWNPYGYGGAPLLAAIQGGVLFPGNVAFLFLPPAAAMNLTVMFCYWLAGVGTFAFGRSLGFSRASAIVSALCFTFGGYMVAHLEHLSMLQIASLMPWALWAIERFVLSRAGRYAWAVAAIAGLQILAGHPQTTIFAFILTAAYGIYRLWSLPAGARAGGFCQLAVAVALGIGLSLAQLLPTLDYIPRTLRETISYDWLVTRSLMPAHLLTWIFPRFFGGVPTAWFPTPYWSVPAISELTGYVGLAAVALVAIAAVSWRARPAVRFWLVACTIALTLALGDSTPIYPWVAKLPLFRQMPVPARHLLEFDFGLAILAGHGFQRILESAERTRARLLAIGWGALALPALGVIAVIVRRGQVYAAHAKPFLPPGVDLAREFTLRAPTFWLPLVGVALLGGIFLLLARRPDRWSRAALIGFIGLDLAIFGLNLGGQQTSPAIADLVDRLVATAPAPSVERIAAFSAGTVYPFGDFALLDALRLPNWGCLYGEREVGGYDAFVESDFASVMDGLPGFLPGFDGEHLAALFGPHDHALDLFNCRELRLDDALAAQPAVKAFLRPPRWTPLPAPARVHAYLNHAALPSVWRVSRERRLAFGQIKQAIDGAVAFDPRAEALIEGPLAQVAPGPGRARLLHRSFDRLEVETDGAGPGLVVVSEAFDPDWQAFDDIGSLPIMRVDGVLIGVRVPAGHQTITLRFEPRLWRTGLAGSLASALALALWGLWLIAGVRLRLVARLGAWGERARGLGRLAWPYGLIACALLAYFAPVLVQGRLLAPGDGLAQFLPARLLIVEALRHGEWPFWNPFLFSGTPLLATIQGGVFFPGNVPFWFVSPLAAMNACVLLALWSIGAGTYTFTRAIGAARGGALVGALVFMLGGFASDHLEHLAILQAVGILPWLLFALERHRASGRGHWAIAASVLIALMVFAGHPQMAAYGLLVSGAYATWRGLSLPSAEKLAYFGRLGAAYALGLALCSLQLLPTFDLIGESQRQSISYKQLTYSSVPISSLPTLLFPFLYGAHGISPLVPAYFWSPVWWVASEEGYVGIATLIFVAIALSAWREEPQIRFWTRVAAVGLMLALGANTPLYKLWAHLPILNSMPYASRHLMEFSLASAVLAALGWNRLLSASSARRWAIGAGGLGAAVLLGWGTIALFHTQWAHHTQPYVPPRVDLANALDPLKPAFWLPIAFWAAAAVLSYVVWRRRTRWAQGLLIATLLVDLGLVGFHEGKQYLCPDVPSDFAARPSLDWGEGRTVTIPAYPYPYDTRSLNYLMRLHAAALAPILGERSAAGYDAFILQPYHALTGMGSLGDVATPRAIWQRNAHVLDVLAVRTLNMGFWTSTKRQLQARLASGNWQARVARGQIRQYENPHALPRAWSVSRAVTLPPADIVARMWGRQDFEPRQEALLEDAAGGSAWQPAQVDATTPSLNRIALHVSGRGPRFVVVSETHDPGWRAYAGARELPVHRVDGLVIGVELPAGVQDVELRYEPPRWRQGLAGSLGSAALLLLWGLLLARRQSGRQVPPLESERLQAA